MQQVSWMNKIIRYMTNRDYRFAVQASHGFHDAAEDMEYVKRVFHGRLGYELNLSTPRTFNEKLQWLKLYDRKPVYTKMVDKFAVKSFVEKALGTKYVIPTLGVWERFEEIDFNALPNRFVLKCTHDSGSTVLVLDKNTFDVAGAKKKITKHLGRNFYLVGREWPYKNVPPRILAETYLEGESGFAPTDYKVLCFMGEPRLIEVHQNRYSKEHTQDFYDLDWNKTEIQQVGEHNSNTLAIKPIVLDEMLQLSKILAKNTYHLRVDWYESFGKLLFGELTFFDSSGFVPFTRYKDDELLGSWIKLDL